MRPTYFVDQDKDQESYSLLVEAECSNIFWVSDFSDKAVAESVCDALNDLCMRLYVEGKV